MTLSGSEGALSPTIANRNVLNEPFIACGGITSCVSALVAGFSSVMFVSQPALNLMAIHLSPVQCGRFKRKLSKEALLHRRREGEGLRLPPDNSVPSRYMKWRPAPSGLLAFVRPQQSRRRRGLG